MALRGFRKLRAAAGRRRVELLHRLCPSHGGKGPPTNLRIRTPVRSRNITDPRVDSRPNGACRLSWEPACRLRDPGHRSSLGIMCEPERSSANRNSRGAQRPAVGGSVPAPFDVHAPPASRFFTAAGTDGRVSISTSSKARAWIRVGRVMRTRPVPGFPGRRTSLSATPNRSSGSVSKPWTAGPSGVCYVSGCRLRSGGASAFPSGSVPYPSTDYTTCCLTNRFVLRARVPRVIVSTGRNWNPLALGDPQRTSGQPFGQPLGVVPRISGRQDLRRIAPCTVVRAGRFVAAAAERYPPRPMAPAEAWNALLASSAAALSLSLTSVILLLCFR